MVLEKLLFKIKEVKVICEGVYCFPKGNSSVHYCDFPIEQNKFRCEFYKSNLEFPILSLCSYNEFKNKSLK